MLTETLTTAARLPPDQILGADPVQVGMIDDGDLAGIEALGDVLRLTVYRATATMPGGGSSALARVSSGILTDGTFIEYILPEPLTPTASSQLRRVTHLARSVTMYRGQCAESYQLRQRSLGSGGAIG